MLRPRWCLYGGLPPLGPGRVLGLRHSRLAAGRNLQRQCHANPLSVTGIPKARHRPVTHSQALAGRLVSAWPQRKKPAHVRHLMAPLKPPHRFASFGQHMLVGVSQAERWESLMLPQDTYAALRIAERALNSLSFQQQPVSFILGQSLRRRDQIADSNHPRQSASSCGGVGVQDGR